MKTFHLTIARVGEQLYSGEAQSVNLPGVEGVFTVLAGHEPFVSGLAAGTARRIVKSGQIFNRIHVGDIAGVLSLLADKETGGVFNLADGAPSPAEDVVAFAAGLMGVEPPPEIPFEQAEMTPMARSFYGENKRVSNRKVKGSGYVFDWPDYRPVLDKIAEELDEVRHEFEHGADEERLADEIGDVLFVAANLARHAKVDVSRALRGANAKFERRFRDGLRRQRPDRLDLESGRRDDRRGGCAAGRGRECDRGEWHDREGGVAGRQCRDRLR